MKKFILSAATISVFVGYILYQKFGGNDDNPVITAPSSSPSGSTTNVTPGATPANVAYKDGTYTGSVADAYVGNVQVSATISGGKITDVQFMDYPKDRSRSMMINNQAMPMLKTEAIQVQSANVNTISGATLTSEAFKQSLDSALAQAK